MSKRVTACILLCLAACTSSGEPAEALSRDVAATVEDAVEAVCGVDVRDVDRGPLRCADGSALVASCHEGFIAACADDGDFQCEKWAADARNCLCGVCR